MHKPWSVPCILTSRCINPLLQRALFLMVACLWLLIQRSLDLVEIHVEAFDTWSMKLVTFVICPMRCRCYCSVQSWALLLQRAELGPLLSWFVATTVMDLLCEVYWVARKQKITIWNTLIIAARCNNLGLCSLQPVFSWCAWPFWLLTMYIPLFLVIGQVCVWECDDPSKCLSYLIEVFVLLAPTFCLSWLDWLDLALCVHCA